MVSKSKGPFVAGGEVPTAQGPSRFELFLLCKGASASQESDLDCGSGTWSNISLQLSFPAYALSHLTCPSVRYGKGCFFFSPVIRAGKNVNRNVAKSHWRYSDVMFPVHQVFWIKLYNNPVRYMRVTVVIKREAESAWAKSWTCGCHGYGEIWTKDFWVHSFHSLSSHFTNLNAMLVPRAKYQKILYRLTDVTMQSNLQHFF